MKPERWCVKHFKEFTADELYRILKARVDVFVVEQECAYEEMDGKDLDALHLYLEKEECIVAYARLLPAGSSYQEPSIGRVLVDQAYRRQGYGTKLVEKSIACIKKEWGKDQIKISAQSHLQHFYGSFGFVKSSSEYIEDGIPHVEMILHMVK